MDIKELKPTERFSHLTDEYKRYRPGYPGGILKTLTRDFGLSFSSVVADIGSGTGKLSEVFLKNGNTVFAVEPNSDMRHTAERLFAKEKKFISVNGTAEKTRLAASSVDFVVAGQAFHWFDREKTKREFKRIQKERGITLLIWNKRDNAKDLMGEYEKILNEKCPGYADLTYDLYSSEEVIHRFFYPRPVKKFVFPNSQGLDLDGLLGRLKSTSYCPGQETESYAKLKTALEALFQRYEKSGEITFSYNCVMYAA